MQNNKRKILILDAEQRSSLAVTRSLGKKRKYNVYTSDCTPSSLAGSSRYSVGYLQSPDPAIHTNEFISWLITQVENYKFTIIIPITEITSRLLLLNKNKFENIEIPFADIDTVLQIADKGNLFKLAEKLDILSPKTKWFNNLDSVKENELEFPLVLKPSLSRIFNGKKWIHTKVYIIKTLNEYKKVIEEAYYLKNYSFMIQEFIPGKGAGLSVLYKYGKPYAFFQHSRLREKPPEGGVSVFSKSVSPDPQMVKAAKRLLSAVSWHGVAMVEFRVTPEGVPYLMEINTRFWGSLQVAIDSGVDFPELLIDESAQPVENYEVNRRLRWLLGDLDSLFIFCKGKHEFSQKLIRFIQFFVPNIKCKQEIFRIKDPWPAFYELRQYLMALVN